MSEHEEMLNGGNINQVVKVGGTVRRNAKPNPYVYDLLKHLEVQGFAHSPRYLGQDDQGREVLTYLEGDVPGDNYPELDLYMWSDRVLTELAKLLRSYHEATSGFVTPHESVNRYPDEARHEVVCHNDAALYNIVFYNRQPVGLIDFDMAGPGPRLWDIAYTLYTSVPLAGFSPGDTDRQVVLTCGNVMRLCGNEGLLYSSKPMAWRLQITLRIGWFRESKLCARPCLSALQPVIRPFRN